MVISLLKHQPFLKFYTNSAKLKPSVFSNIQIQYHSIKIKAFSSLRLSACWLWIGDLDVEDNDWWCSNYTVVVPHHKRDVGNHLWAPWFNTGFTRSECFADMRVGSKFGVFYILTGSGIFLTKEARSVEDHWNKNHIFVIGSKLFVYVRAQIEHRG